MQKLAAIQRDTKTRTILTLHKFDEFGKICDVNELFQLTEQNITHTHTKISFKQSPINSSGTLQAVFQKLDF